ncbi:MAG: NAD(P)-dependent oxidoreductase [Spirochaetales bacterium]|nr:NAD(P)-dependent oxidoreductase [Spirochaetales bacterium]
MANILVTGGAGFVGSKLVPKLLNAGHYVRVLDNFMYRNHESLLSCFEYKDFEVIVGDINDASVVEQALKGMDVIIHLAAIVGFPACKQNPALADFVNYEGTWMIEKNRSKNQYIIFASTGSNYGSLANEICTEDTSLNPLTEYGISKTKAEQYLMDQKNVTALSFATGFGLSNRLRLDLLVNDFVYNAIKNRSLIIYEKYFKRSFIHVSDMARAIIFTMDHMDKMKDNVYNVGDESMNYDKEEVALEIKKRVDFYLHFADIGQDADKRNYVVSYDKIHKLGFKTKMSLQDGIEELMRGLSIVLIKQKYSNV